MKLLIASVNFAPEVTGIGKYSGEMASWLARRGHVVDVVAGPPYYPEWRVHEEYRGRGFRAETIDGVNVMRVPLFVPHVDEAGTLGRVALETSYTVAAARWWLPILLSRTKYDVVVAVCPPLQAAAFPWLYARVRGVPWVLHVQDLQVDAALRLGMIGSKTLSKALFGLENRILQAANRVSSISTAMLERLLDKGVDADKAFALPNWADVHGIRPSPASAEVRRGLGAGPGDTLVLYSGNLGEKQGLDVILQAARVLADAKQIRFAIVGSGTAKSTLERRIQSERLGNVVLHNLFPREELPELLNAAEVHLVVQRPEAADLVMPSKLTNILSAGKPAVVTASPGSELHKVVAENAMGIAVDPDSPEQLAAAIRSLAENSGLREELGANARQYAENNLSEDVILEGLEKVLTQLTNQAG